MKDYLSLTIFVFLQLFVLQHRQLPWYNKTYSLSCASTLYPGLNSYPALRALTQLRPCTYSTSYMRILFLTPRFPYPPLKGDTLRVYHQLRVLSKRHRITLISMTESPVIRSDYEHIAELCEHVSVVALPRWRAIANVGAGMVSRQPMQVSYYRAAQFKQQLRTALTGERYDVVHTTLIRMLPYVWTLKDPPVVVDLIDSLSLNLADRRAQVRGPKRLGYEIEYRRVREYERAVVAHFPALIVSSAADREILVGSRVRDEGVGTQWSEAKSRAPLLPHPSPYSLLPITVIPNGVDLERFPFHEQMGRDSDTLVFTGNMGYHPNEEAVLWFASQVWPLLHSKHPNLCFQVVGTNPSERVRALAAPGTGIQVLGRVDDVTAYLGKATIAVCPMRSGSGIQNKVLEAMSVGAPVAATSIANRGVQGIPERDLLIADDPSEFAASVARLLNEPDTRANLARSARTFVEQNYRWEQHGDKLEAIYSRVVGEGVG